MVVAIGLSELAVDLAVEADDAPFPAIGDEPHLAVLPGLEPRRGPGRNVEPVAAGLFAVKGQRCISLVKMIMRADLDRPVTSVSDNQSHRRAADIELDV